jgi:cystathionine beta-synthase
VKYAQDICDLIGRTPLVRLNDTVADLPPLVLAKLEFLNPCGSIKDRMAHFMISYAEERGLLKPGDTVVDNTSGNTGAGAAMVCAAKGYTSVFTTPEKTSTEKRDLIKSFGAGVIITPADVPWDDPLSFYMQAKRIGEKPGHFWLDQYHSQINVEGHYRTTGPEIWEDTDGRVTHFVCGIGTGGTISGTSKYLKEQNPKIKTIGVDPIGSLFAAYKRGEALPEPRPYKVEGIGTDVITKAFLKEYVDEVIQVSDRDAFATSRELCRREGISTGGSSGACLWAIRQYCRDLEEDDIVVTVFADGGIRYLSKMYNDKWMTEHGLLPECDVAEEKEKSR